MNFIIFIEEMLDKEVVMLLIIFILSPRSIGRLLSQYFFHESNINHFLSYISCNIFLY